MKRTILLLAALALMPVIARSGEAINPSATYKFAQRDTCDLFLDIYNPAPGSETTVNGKTKPSILFVFGGGFVSGARNEGYLKEYYKMLTDNGFRVIAPDYRLGMKGFKGAGMNKEFIAAMENSINIAVEDLFSATKFIIDNAAELGIDPSCIVAAGSSAGAITVLQGEWEISNSTDAAAVLPEGFNFAGIMSFSGAIYNREGGPVYATAPCPTLLFHGTADKVVKYKQLKLGKLFFGGAKPLAKAYGRNGFNYNVYRYDGNSHEVAVSMTVTLPEQIGFITTNILGNERRIIDALVTDPRLDPYKWEQGDDYKGLYD